MSDDLPPLFNGNIRALLSPDGSDVILKIETDGGVVDLRVGTEMIAVLMSNLRAISASAEQRRRSVDPFAGKDGDTVVQAAMCPTHYGVGKMLQGEQIGVMFHVSGAPETFLLTRQQAADIARMLLSELAGNGVQPPSVN